MAVVEYAAEGDGFRAWIWRSNSIGWYCKIEMQSHPTIQLYDTPRETRSLANCKRWAKKIIKEYA